MQNSCALDGQLYTRQPLLLAISEILENPHKVKYDRGNLLLVYLLDCKPQKKLKMLPRITTCEFSKMFGRKRHLSAQSEQ